MSVMVTMLYPGYIIFNLVYLLHLMATDKHTLLTAVIVLLQLTLGVGVGGVLSRQQSIANRTLYNFDPLRQYRKKFIELFRQKSILMIAYAKHVCYIVGGFVWICIICNKIIGAWQSAEEKANAYYNQDHGCC